MAAAGTRDARPPAAVALELLDVDVHPVLTGPLEQIFEYMPRAQREKVTYLGHIPLVESPLAYTFLTGRWVVGLNAEPERDAPAGSTPAGFRADLLDARRVDVAQLIATEAAGHALQSRNYDLSAALMSAFNDFMLEHWVRDDRARYALMVNLAHPASAVAEIRRHGEDPRVSSVWLAGGQERLGARVHDPVYEAALEVGLPVLTHPGGPAVALAPAEYGIEGRFNGPMQTWANIASLVAHGAAERFGGLTFVFAECGFSWLPALLRRMDAAWRASGSTGRLPSELVREQVRLTTTPFDDDREPAELARLIEDPASCLSDVLVYSSNYPRSRGGWPGDALAACSEPVRRKIFSENARAALRI